MGHFARALSALSIFWIASLAQAAGDVLPPWLEIRQPVYPAPTAAPDRDGRYAVDVLVLYTPRYQARLGGVQGVLDEAHRLIAFSNRLLANSKVNVHFNLVGLGAYSATDEDNSVTENRVELPQNPAVQALRDQVAADLVVLMRTEDGQVNVCGLGSAFNAGERSDPPANVDPERDAFSVVVAAGLEDGSAGNCNDYVFPHELGHALGAGHNYLFDQAIGSLVTSWKPYAHGAVCAGVNGQASYVSVVFGIGLDGLNAAGLQLGAPVGDFFSNPDLLLDGEFCGLASAVEEQGPAEALQADNARAMREAAPYVAAYRASLTARVQARNELADTQAGAMGSLLLCTLLGLSGFRRPSKQRTA